MSAETRTELAAAASLVAGVNVKGYSRQTTKAGDGWVSLLRLDRDDSGLGFMATWAVTVIVPQDVKAAEEWIDTHALPLTFAIEDVLTVTAVIPATLVGDKVLALVIEGVRAH